MLRARVDEAAPPTRARSALLTLLALAITAAYVFFLSAGSFVSWPTHTTFYDLLAEGFRLGQLHLPLAPAPELLAQPNPFDPAHRPLWLWDASLHEGRYYIYWGPLPAIVLALIKSALGSSVVVGDQYIVFAFYVLSLLAGTLLLERLARRCFPSVTTPLVACAVVVFAFANPGPYVLARAAIYEAAIAGGQAFLLLGTVAAFEAVWSDRYPSRALLGAGCCWALALSCRFSLAPVVFLLVVLTSLTCAMPAARPRRALAGAALRLAAPVAIVSGALLVYNRARFDAWLDFGVAKQLSNVQYRSDLTYAWVNLYSYALRKLELGCAFPFVTAPWKAPGALPAWLSVPPGYVVSEPVAGVLRAVPWAWLCPAALFLAGRALLRGSGERTRGLADRRTRLRAFSAVAFTVLATVGLGPVLGLFFASQRYLYDVSSGIVLLAALGAFWLVDEAGETGWARALGVLTGLTALATVAIGGLLGFDGYYALFAHANPELYHSLAQKLTVCRAAP